MTRELCAETAKGARKWNDANILVLNLSLASEIGAKEILDRSCLLHASQGNG